MPHTRRTLALTTDEWDITLDGVGKIEVTGGAMATAQAVANEARLFTNDAYFIQDRGTPYFALELGQRVNPAVLREYLRKAAERVEDVAEVLSVEVSDVDAQTRTVTGAIVFRTVEGGENGSVNF